MNLDFTAEENAFRQEVREFIAANYPPELRAKQDARAYIDRDAYISWHKVLARKGWVAPSWPVEYGGTGWTASQKYIWADETARANCQPTLSFNIQMIGPVLYTFGSEEQKQRFLPGIYSGETWWCQGFSEPGAGSDLASLKTRAEIITESGRDYYLVNGQKTWTTKAHFADWGFFLVRTDAAAKPQAGISFLLIDMKSPGVTVRPIITIEGGHEVNEVFLDNVNVPVENRVYEENKGWTLAKFLLGLERTGIAKVAESRFRLRKLRQIALVERSDDGAALLDDALFRRKLAQLEIDVTALEFTELRMLSKESGGGTVGPESSLLKIKGSEIQQRIQELTLEAVGHYGEVFPGNLGRPGIGPDYAAGVANEYLNGRKSTIYGGATEIQRNIIAKAVLRL
jgi:alkylation response protein AidB-like acyl-CoA dehydrogenase